MSYKLNLKAPERKNKMRLRRMSQHARVATTTRPRRKINRDGTFRFLTPKQGNKYILTGPACNVKSPTDIYYPNGILWNYWD